MDCAIPKWHVMGFLQLSTVHLDVFIIASKQVADHIKLKALNGFLCVTNT